MLPSRYRVVAGFKVTTFGATAFRASGLLRIYREVARPSAGSIGCYLPASLPVLFRGIPYQVTLEEYV